MEEITSFSVLHVNTWKFHILFAKNHFGFNMYLNSEADWMIDSTLFCTPPSPVRTDIPLMLELN